MSSTLLRLGLWTILAVVVLYVLHETYTGTPFVQYFSMGTLQKVLIVGGLLVVAGIVARAAEKGAKAVTKNRCVVCKVPVPPGAIYCRAHLRRVLQAEDDLLHKTQNRRLP